MHSLDLALGTTDTMNKIYSHQECHICHPLCDQNVILSSAHHQNCQVLHYKIVLHCKLVWASSSETCHAKRLRRAALLPLLCCLVVTKDEAYLHLNVFKSPTTKPTRVICHFCIYCTSTKIPIRTVHRQILSTTKLTVNVYIDAMKG